MKETTFRELKEGQIFYLEKEGRLSEWKKTKPTEILPFSNDTITTLQRETGNKNINMTNAVHEEISYLYVSERETVWVKV